MKKFLLFFTIIFSQFAYSQSDCISAIPLCGNSAISYTPTGPGLVLETLGGCLSDDENFSVWYSFTAATTGTLSFTITPNNLANDYDFGVYGPNPSCAALGTPIRCNFSGTPGLTGLSDTQTGSQWSPILNVIAGEVYFIVVDNYSNSQFGFSLTFGGTALLTSPFNNPTVQPNPFIAPGLNADGNILICSNPATFDFSTLSTGIINGNPNFTVAYYLTPNNLLTNTSPITTPIVVNTAATYYYAIKYTDPANPSNAANQCTINGEIRFVQGAIVVNNATISGCANNNATTAVFNLTTAAVFAGPAGNTFQYYPTLADLNNNTNLITNPTTYTSAPGDVYVKVTTAQGCTGSSKITLVFFAPIVQTPATLVSCFIEGNPTTAMFDLTSANVSSTTGVVKTYFKTNQDAVNQTNQIPNAAATAYIAGNSEIFVRVTSTNGCWNIVKVTLTVTPPVYSTVLKDKIICVEDTTTLDAGTGFDGYRWSTGATTQTITNVSVGNYYVDLRKNGCVTRQAVKVLASQIPVITNIEITNNTAVITVNGGLPPYKYSVDGTNFQDSNTFTNLPRGINTIYVKDSYDCNPVFVDVDVLNLVNAISPNGDNVNDYVDYSALSYKKALTFTVYDRYGNQLYVADKNNQYKWAGTANGGRKIITGTYWYSITWEESATNTLVSYSGWILVKNQ
ncbi:T9SS type B sorting domain-containing protein [Frigoriflavimonas asaccharolytica]|uniref:Gliding motility-associated-like protein n=1 Tax=Frigoriflavimonas asaccharolytica TaxID=2735899 RepID=A0A8J8G921_9FLAO|nr:gliding motility-associated C-terminal domain-containing protein [Frigoriflavimonas asaccharolytica]NRS92187.1 gliding motility-associated-like protein [Frigoriflavimonas asaccharolytica]